MLCMMQVGENGLKQGFGIFQGCNKLFVFVYYAGECYLLSYGKNTGWIFFHCYRILQGQRYENAGELYGDVSCCYTLIEG